MIRIGDVNWVARIRVTFFEEIIALGIMVNIRNMASSVERASKEKDRF